MTTSYTTKTTFTDNHIIIESMIGGEQKIDVIARGENEDIDLQTVSVAHKLFASTTLGTDIGMAGMARVTRTAAAAAGRK